MKQPRRKKKHNSKKIRYIALCKSTNFLRKSQGGEHRKALLKHLNKEKYAVFRTTRSKKKRPCPLELHPKSFVSNFWGAVHFWHNPLKKTVHKKTRKASDNTLSCPTKAPVFSRIRMSHQKKTDRIPRRNFHVK